MTINQGICGKAFQEANETSKSNIREESMLQESSEENRFKLNDKQKKVVKGIIIAASCPLVMKDKDIDGIKKKVIGVLNVESRSPASLELFSDASVKDEFYEKIVMFAKIYLNLH